MPDAALTDNCLQNASGGAHLADPAQLLLQLLHEQPLIPHVQAAVAHSLFQQVGQRLATKVETLHTWRHTKPRPKPSQELEQLRVSTLK